MTYSRADVNFIKNWQSYNNLLTTFMISSRKIFFKVRNVTQNRAFLR